MKLTKQKRNLINELSLWILKEIEYLNESNKDNRQNIATLINVVKSSKDYTNKQIKTLINDFKYQLPF
jgi:flagellar biosynthesis regulator FlaF